MTEAACDPFNFAFGIVFGIVIAIAGMLGVALNAGRWSWKKRQERRYERRVHGHADIYLRAGIEPERADRMARADIEKEASEVLKEML